ncbi:uncharacterized protein GIQ15_02561 [Arthroderma uncinatum]|uniref:uncharacterized protein n=1 Tax=Arthroderma uncinatum TaxID=74035 RepID=UPI00144AE10C|nr:uncharacterized protein GIQ15_02561 [Arthroderma uncinatum]KAF3483237.1 hypothetical protein GIQ15_02561 [Arthroderma uncinatum]
MEETLDVDDLFGDSGGLELSLTAAVPSKALPARIDELRLLGCCQKIAWSKMGAIAYIAPDGTKAFLRHLSCGPENGKWGLSDGDPDHPIADAQGGHTLVHLSWNESGTDIAIVDSCGRISIIAMSVALNVLIPSRPAILDSDDDGNQPVGLMWLSINRSESKWGDMVVELHSTGYTNDILTHAAMAPVDGGGIMVVTYSASNDLRLYRAQLKWEGAPVDTAHQRPNNSIAVPSIQLVHIEVEVPHVVPSPSTYALGNPENIANNANGLFALTHLQVIACPLDSPGGQTAPAILAVFSYPIHNSHGRSHIEHPSVLARWEFRSVTQNLHRSFDNIVSKQARHPLLPNTELRRQADLYFERHIVSVDYMEAGNVLVITLEDSSINFYDAKNFTPLSGLDDVETVTSLPQSGFAFPPAISPDEKSQVQIRIMEHSFGAEDGLFNDGKFMSALAALTMAYCRACSSDSNNDDVLMIVMQQLNADSHKNFINEVYRALSMNVDFTIEQDKLMNNPYILKCFSMQAALGFKTRLERRNLAAAVPWVTLQLRQISILLAYMHFNKAGAESECHDPEVLRITLGNVKWALDLAKYLVDDLFEISDNFGNQVNSQESGTSPADSALKVDVYEKLLASVDNDVKHAYQNAGFTNSDRAAPERDLLITGSIPPVLQPAVTSILTKTMPMVRNEANPMYLFLQDYSWLGVGDDKRTDIYRRRYELDILRKVLIPLDEPRGTEQRPSRSCGGADVNEDSRTPGLYVWRNVVYEQCE